MSTITLTESGALSLIEALAGAIRRDLAEAIPMIQIEVHKDTLVVEGNGVWTINRAEYLRP